MTCASRVNNYSFYGIFNNVQKNHLLFSTGISIVHILVRSMCLVTTIYLPVCLVLRSVNNMTLVPALRCVKRQIVNTFFTLMSVGKRRHSTKRWS